ncbi:MAG: DUF2207 domain-containing protein [Clostridia bacterium]|nr:DUF2207 domain-containing protein [Clostridia bacterium]
MKEILKILFLYFFAFFVIPFLFIGIPEFIENPPAWNPFDYARITDIDYKAIVLDEPNHGGNILVTERMTFDVHAASKNNTFWELWRALPENEVDGLHVKYKVNSVKQILDDGTEIIYEESPKLYWYDNDYIDTAGGYGPGKWYHSEGPYNEYLDQYECVLFYVDGLYREKVTFEIEYEMSNAALRYADCSELYLTMYSEETIKYLESFKAQILFPNKDMPAEEYYYAKAYGTNSHQIPYTESSTANPGYHTFLIDLDEADLQFKPYNQYIEFLLVSHGRDKQIFTEHAPKNIYSDDVYLEESRELQAKHELLPDEYMLLKILVFVLAILGIFVIFFLATIIIKVARKKHTFYKPEMQFEYFREIPNNLDPNFAAYLVFSKHKSSKKLTDREDGYSGLLLSLIRKKYISLEKIDINKDWTLKNTKLIINQTKQQLEKNLVLEPLTLAEKHYFDLIYRYTPRLQISMKDFQSKVSSDYVYTNSFVSNIDSSIKKIGVGEKYFQNSQFDTTKNTLRNWSVFFVILGIFFITLVNIWSYPTRLDLAFGAFFITGIAFLLAANYLSTASKNSILLTQYGETEYAKWRGLYNFLNSETLMSEKELIELPLWEQYLVYATAFGISEKVIKALKIRCPEFETSPVLSNSYHSSSSFRHSSRSFNSATRSATRSYSRNSYSSGYGSGYGYGGRGGGGGGGGH